MNTPGADPTALAAIIGGSGLFALPGLDLRARHQVNTRWGAPSAAIHEVCHEDRQLLFLPRHGDRGQLAPHQINYRANLAALAELGATTVLAFNTVGGIGAALTPGSLVVPDQIIDYTWGREHSYADASAATVQHVDFTEPFSAPARRALIAAAASAGVAVHEHAVYGATQGPRLESAAEIRRLERDGCDVVGMTGMPEAGLARELGLAYACLALVVNPAAGLGGAIHGAAIAQVLASSLPRVIALLLAACRAPASR